MRFKRRYLVLAFASVAAFAVGGGVASGDHGPGGNTGVKCTATVTTCEDNTSALKIWNVTPSELPGSGGGGTNGGSGTTAAVALDVETASYYAHPGDSAQGGKVANVKLDFDNDVVVNLTGVPNCTAAAAGGLADWTASTTIAKAWEDCGPGADTAPEANAYLSPSTAVSGTVSTAPPANFAGCDLIFRKDATHLILFARVTFAATANCGTPATNTTGNTSTILTGTLSNPGTGDYKTRLTVPLPATIPLALDDFKAKVKRASVFKARCVDTNKRLHLKGVFTYTDNQTEQPPDTVTKFKACT
jgi:hypothetical protein